MMEQRTPVLGADELASASWHVSSFSGSGNNCLEHGASTASGMQFVRDTKDRDGGTLAFSAAAWQAFVKAVVTEEFGAV
ncbi:DUF397 domain-containing protein [Streptomyces sp. NPDC092296]|uniref:DUF397 domain-containing protein n=1 Tax=Streptomyces sp. NPDC092296 TaxID=3366012 RepID=UPI0037F781CC